MNQPQKIGKNSAILAAARLIDRVSGVVLAVFISRMLHATGLGIYAAAQAYYELITTIVDSGGSLLLAREIGKDRSTTNYYLFRVCLLACTLSIVLIPIMRLALPHVGLSASLANAMSIVTLAVIAGSLISFQESVFVAHQRTEFITFTALVTNIIFTASGAYLLLHGYDIPSLLILFVVVQYINAGCNFYFINRYISPIRWDFDVASVPSILRQIRVLTGLSVLASIFSRPELIIISLVSSASQIGLYSAALKIASLWQIVPQIFMTNVFPVLAHSYHTKSQAAHDLQSKSVKYLLAVSLPITVGIIVTSHSILDLLYGPGFAAAATPLRILAFNIPLVSLWAVLWRILVARNQQGTVLRVMLVITTAEIGGGYLIISALGSIGAAISASLSSLVYVLFLAVSVRRGDSHLNYWHLSWRFVLAACGMGMLTCWISRLLQLWALIPLAAAVYLVLAIALKAFTSDDWALLRRMGRS